MTGDLFGLLELLQRVDGGVNHVDRIGRPEGLGEHVVHAGTLENSSGRATGNNTGTRGSRTQHHDTGGLLTDHRMGDSTTDQRHLEEMLLGFLNGLGDSCGHLFSLAVADAYAALTVTHDDERENRSLHGLTRTLINNMVIGVTEGYEKKLEIQGVGYRVLSKGPKQLEFNLGFSHPVIVDAPEGITFAVENPTKFSVQGIDKQVVGETAANIRKIRKPEPYKGKGVRYEGENVRRKVGKAGK